MTLTIRSILLSLSALLVTGTLTACDSAEELEALGVDIADLDDMTEEELDALPCLDEPDLTTPPSAPLPPSLDGIRRSGAGQGHHRKRAH